MVQLSHGGRVRWGGMNKKHGQLSLGGAISCKQLYVNGAARVGGTYISADGATVQGTVSVDDGHLFINNNAYNLMVPRLVLSGGLGDMNTSTDNSCIQWGSQSTNDTHKAGIWAFPFTWAGVTRTHIIVQAGDGNQYFIAGWMSLYTVSYPSDDLLKFNEEALSVGLDAVKLLQPRRYLKVQSLSDEQVPANAWTEFGFVAQEVEQVPGLDVLVRERPDTKDFNKTVKTVDYTGIAAVNTQALKELLAKVEALEARVAVLEGGASN